MLCAYSLVGCLAFLPANNLWLEDTQLDQGQINEAQFNRVVDALEKLYQPLAQEQGETFDIIDKWDSPIVNAQAGRLAGQVEVTVYGGLARRSELSIDAFALALCHEIGHVYGGKPYRNVDLSISVEGQADYYGTNRCLAQIMPLIELERDLPLDLDIDRLCEIDGMAAAENIEDAVSVVSRRSDLAPFCSRLLHAGASIISLFSHLFRVPMPSYGQQDSHVVKETLIGYPKTLQCRLDTFRAGVFNQARPFCWWAPALDPIAYNIRWL